MGKRELKDTATEKYFKPADAPHLEPEEGKRELHPLLPFVVSGGRNTERYYFQHITDVTNYKFNVKPEYFGEESRYTELFPKWIEKILTQNNDAKVFCVFDWDTIRENEVNIEKHGRFVRRFEKEINSGSVILCPSMPCIEYWFLLHFTNYTNLIDSCGKAMGLLAPYIKPYFSENKRPSILLKREKYLKDSGWVKKLCEDSKLEAAIITAEQNIKAAVADGVLDKQSYSFVYRLFK